MSIKLKKLLRKAVHKTRGFSFYLLWIDIRYGVEEWFCLKTWKWRLKHTKRIQLSSMAYNQPQMSWDDVEVADQWGLWLPLGFGIVSKSNWDFDQKINQDIGQPVEPWQDFVDGSWPTYYYKDEFLTNNHYFDAARKNMKRKLGDDVYEKEFEVRLFVQSQKSLDDDTKQWVDWVANGSKPMKVEFSDQAKEDITRLFGEEQAEDMFKHFEDKKSDVDSTEQEEK